SVSTTEVPVKISESYKKSGLQIDNMKTIHSRLIKSMQQNRLFLNPTLSLSVLSKELNIPTHHITQTLNEYAGLSFYDFVNSFRVNEFKKGIHAPENKNFSLLGIAFDCGFNSKSSFNRIFKQKTGLSPSEFQKNTTA
ncbi:MAG: helix-turn-helix domain-containing protein, partial [Bacteroidales bacterium]|nr:helix-turn-helix domain-containing protein [Bacteroidales bacterium]